MSAVYSYTVPILDIFAQELNLILKNLALARGSVHRT